jgi:hypothetical protein
VISACFSVLLVIGAVLTITGLVFSIAAIVSPAWEIVDIREFNTQHEHGLWLDCARTVKTGIVNREPYTYYGDRHCTYKFDFASTKQSGGIFFDQAPDSENAGHFEYKGERNGKLSVKYLAQKNIYLFVYLYGNQYFYATQIRFGSDYWKITLTMVLAHRPA